MEAQTSDLIAVTSTSATKLESIASTLVAIDGKLDQHMTALDEHKAEDQDTAMKVHDLEQAQSKRIDFGKNASYAFWTAAAGIVADLAVHLAEHIPHLLGK